MTSVYNAGGWAGTKALVAPMSSTIDLGAIVWERGRDEPSDSQKRGGMVMGRRVDEDTGELFVKLLQKSKASGKLNLHVIELAAADLDPALMQPASRQAMHRIVGVLCAYVGQGAGQVAGFRRWCLESAVGLLGLADDLEAAAIEAGRAS